VKTIQITQKCITNGQPGLQEYCPIALALKKKGYKNVYVGQLTTRFTDKKKLFIFNLPCDAREFVAKFDKREYVEPFKLVLVKPFGGK
jgi:hypothetical protein